MERDQLRIALSGDILFFLLLLGETISPQETRISHEASAQTYSSEKLFLDILSACGHWGLSCAIQSDSTAVLKNFPPHPQVPFPHLPRGL